MTTAGYIILGLALVGAFAYYVVKKHNRRK